MTTVYLVCFVLGLVLSMLAAFAGAGRLHFGHLRLPHFHVHTHGAMDSGVSALNGFTLPAFLCWFGGVGYLLLTHTGMLLPIVLVLAALAGLLGASVLYFLLFRILLPRERVLTAADTRMEGVVGRVSGEIRAGSEGIGEILFSQIDARRHAPARSESGVAIPRGTEVVVLRYVRGVAYVSPLHELIAGEERQVQTQIAAR